MVNESIGEKRTIFSWSIFSTLGLEFLGWMLWDHEPRAGAWTEVTGRFFLKGNKTRIEYRTISYLWSNLSDCDCVAGGTLWTPVNSRAPADNSQRPDNSQPWTLVSLSYPLLEGFLWHLKHSLEVWCLVNKQWRRELVGICSTGLASRSISDSP